jgi:nucleoid-associated protein YgaU
VQRGDSLWKIAQKQYGDGRAWRKIYNANRGRIANPSDVPIGTKLIIP